MGQAAAMTTEIKKMDTDTVPVEETIQTLHKRMTSVIAALGQKASIHNVLSPDEVNARIHTNSQTLGDLLLAKMNQQSGLLTAKIEKIEAGQQQNTSNIETVQQQLKEQSEQHRATSLQVNIVADSLSKISSQIETLSHKIDDLYTRHAQEDRRIETEVDTLRTETSTSFEKVNASLVEVKTHMVAANAKQRMLALLVAGAAGTAAGAPQVIEMFSNLFF
jgi:chromosome segregation ATPase